jgi:Uma2 family endonuclease
MAIATQPTIPVASISLEEFLILPETKPASEYINGKIHQKPMPQGQHSIIQSEIILFINQGARKQKIAYAFPELRCAFAGRVIVPDLAIFEWKNISLDPNSEAQNRIEIPPDWIIEILSPDRSSIRVIEKISFAIKNGTKLGWLIDPIDRKVLVFDGDRLPEFKDDDDDLPALKVFPDWHLSVRDLFNLLTFSA